MAFPSTLQTHPNVQDMEQQYIAAEQDHNAINIKLEEFTTNFTDTVKRIFVFLGVPPKLLPDFLQKAKSEVRGGRPEEKGMAASDRALSLSLSLSMPGSFIGRVCRPKRLRAHHGRQI